ncbi:putative ribonuclease H-like domain-containing protein [Tanacetum coccineum]
MMSSASSSSKRESRGYDVFLSFRGDTRNKFTSHLEYSLKQNHIRYFKDERSIDIRNVIAPKLQKSIEASKIAVVKSIMELYMMNRQHGRMILEENRVTRPKKYSELSTIEAIQADCDVKVTNIILQGLPPEVYALSPQYGSPYQSQQYLNNQSSTPLSITYPSNDYQSSVYHNVYSPLSSIPQLEYAPLVNQQSEFSQPDSGLIIPVFHNGDDPIDAISHMISFLTTVITSRYPTTNNQLRNSSNPRATWKPSGKQRTVNCYNCKGEGHMSKQCTKPKRKRDDSWFKDKVLLVQAQASGQILHEEELAFLADL